jgi:archaellum component FlaG (FlaF/FlaG flagellin family)
MSVNLFGRSYEQAGSSNADFLIKTRGQVKIQYGSKFIDLIKDGKINTEAKFIYKEKEVGVKDGIYVIGDGEEAKVVLLVSGE